MCDQAALGLTVDGCASQCVFHILKGSAACKASLENDESLELFLARRSLPLLGLAAHLPGPSSLQSLQM